MPPEAWSFTRRAIDLRCASNSTSSDGPAAKVDKAAEGIAGVGGDRDGGADKSGLKRDGEAMAPALHDASSAHAPAIRADTAPKLSGSVDDILARRRRQDMLERTGSERYLPTEDPNAFLLPDNRLEPNERKWQKVFVALPWAVFLVMLAVPTWLVRSNLPWVKRMAEETEQEAAARAAAEAPARRIPDFVIVNFGQMPDILERPFPTLLMLFDPGTFASKAFLPACRDLGSLLRAAGVPVAFAALDMSKTPGPPDEFMWEYPRALSPYFQLVLPRAHDGEAGVVDYDGRWSVRGLAEAARSLAGPRAPLLPADDLDNLECGLERLRDALFELLFMGEAVQTASQPGRMRRWFGRPEPSVRVESGEGREGDLATADAAILSEGLHAAATICEASVRKRDRGERHS